MRDVTKDVLAQSKEFGRKANENITRLDNYCNKVKNIFRVLNVRKMHMRFLVGEDEVGHAFGKCNTLLKLVKVYGACFFLNIYYTAARDTILIRINGSVPEERAEILLRALINQGIYEKELKCVYGKKGVN